MRVVLLAVLALVVAPAESEARCTRLPESASTAFNTAANKITLPWRTDYTATLASQTHAWQALQFDQDWRGYIAAVLSEVKASGVQIANKTITMPGNAPWYIALWMDYTDNGREPLLGLTKERGPDAGDLAPDSPGGRQVWAIGWYNAEGAFGLGQVFADPCNPKVPQPAGGQPWTFPNHTASFKLLFTDMTESQLPYLGGSPVVEAMIDPPSGSGERQKRELRLLQVDVAVRDPQAMQTEWVFGTFVWKGPKTGDGLFDNLVPVGLMWGNDPARENPVWANFAPMIQQSQLNPDLAGVVWQGAGVTWPRRPYPGFHGRVNGPADNLRSSCLSCHSLAQWRRHPGLRLLPTYSLNPPNGPPDADKITDIRTKYFRNVKGGTLVDPNVSALALDYSLQLEAAFTRMCAACREQKMTGATPDLCRLPGSDRINRANCEMTLFERLRAFVLREDTGPDREPPPRQ